MIAGYRKAWIGALAAFLSSLVASSIDWGYPSAEWVNPFLIAVVSALGAGGAVAATPNRPKER